MRLRRRGEAFEGRPNRLAVSTSPLFQLAVAASGIAFDDAQRAAIVRLSAPPIHGFYLWGAVGRGKSMLSDLYYDAVPTARKRRFHFHSFFRELQTEIAATRQPVENSISRILGSARVVLFDEFHVHDVADAVYLTKTLDALMQQGVLVLATSNYAPDELMPNPLFHV
ncbi:cell division protein ZapE [Arthrobacter russicus]|uniref:cell division protein ZapE n=1 Tax=Arthrobacter russicus TaxID=172040 RepID=UPI003CEE1FE3